METQQINGGVTDENGNFTIQTPKGTFDISFEFISFKKVAISNKVIDSFIDFGTIKLEEETSSLDEVVVIAEKTTVNIRLDKNIVLEKIDQTWRKCWRCSWKCAFCASRC